jgi:hypothetical protein
MLNADKRALELQRCDACSRFDSDSDVQELAASDESMLAAVLEEFCGALLAEAQCALDEKTTSRIGLTRALTTIRDSLTNAVALSSKRTSTVGIVADQEPGDLPSSEREERTYLVGVREVHVRHYEVVAANPDAAKSLVSERGPEVTDIEFEEYSHELDPETWSVEEKP